MRSEDRFLIVAIMIVLIIGIFGSAVPSDKKQITYLVNMFNASLITDQQQYTAQDLAHIYTLPNASSYLFALYNSSAKFEMHATVYGQDQYLNKHRITEELIKLNIFNANDLDLLAQKVEGREFRHVPYDLTIARLYLFYAEARQWNQKINN